MPCAPAFSIVAEASERFVAHLTGGKSLTNVLDISNNPTRWVGYKLRVAAGLVSADDKVGDKPPPYAGQNSCLLRQPNSARHTCYLCNGTHKVA